MTAAIVLADGLALHAVSSMGWLSRRRQLAALGRCVDALLADHVRRRTGSGTR